MPKNTKKYEEEGLVRVELDMDFRTYTFLLALVKKSGYLIGAAGRQKSEGIRGVVSQGILELYQKYVEEKGVDNEEEPPHNVLDKVNQQAYIFANHARAMRKNGIPIKDIISTLQSKLPDYLKKHETGKLLDKETMKDFLVASTFSSIELPKLSSAMKKELIKKRIDKYIKSPTKK